MYLTCGVVYYIENGVNILYWILYVTHSLIDDTNEDKNG